MHSISKRQGVLEEKTRERESELTNLLFQSLTRDNHNLRYLVLISETICVTVYDSTYWLPSTIHPSEDFNAIDNFTAVQYLYLFLATLQIYGILSH